MRNRLLPIIFILLLIFNIIIIYTPENTTKGTNVSGTQVGLWNLAGSPYVVTADVLVPQGEFLDIRPGVQVRFQLDTMFTVRGMLYANGTAGQKITFTSNLGSPYIYTWSGVRFRGVGTGQMENCSISWAKNGIDAKLTTRLRIKNSEIFNCSNGTRFNTVSVSSVENCVIHDNLIHGFHSKWGMGLIRVMNSTFYNNAKGISFSFTWASLISNNTLYDNMRGIRLRHTFNCLIINNSIKNTTYPRPIPGKWPGTHFGIQMNRSNSNIFVNNSIIDTLGYGIKIKTSSNNTFYGNYIENSTDYGMYIFNLCTKNRFINNTIKNINSSAIRLETSSSGNYFRNNTITKYFNEYAVDYQLDSIWNWFISNTVNNEPLRIYFNEPGSVITSDLTGKSISEPKMTNLGQVVIIDSSDFRIHTGSFYDGNAGLFLYNVHNGIIENSTIINMEDYGIYFGYNSTNITVINSTLTISVTASGYFYVGEYSNITVLNTTFDQSKVILKDASNLTIKWYLHVRVFSPLDELVSGALVTVRDRFGTVVYNRTTTSKGTVRFIMCTDKIRSDKTTVSFNNYNVTVFKLNFQPGYGQPKPKMTSSKWVTIKLKANREPILDEGISPEITHNRTPTISWYEGHDPDVDRLLYYINIWSFKQPSIILESNSTYKTKYSLKYNLSYGERYLVNVTATDTYGGWSNTIEGYFDVVNNPPGAPIIKIYPEQTKRIPSKNVNLNCTIVNESFDRDTKPKDIIKYTFLWYLNDELVENASIWNTTKLFHVLDKNYTNTNDVWRCDVRATDGFEYSKWVPATRVIRNTLPYVKNTFTRLVMLEDTVDIGSIKLPIIFTDDDDDLLEYNFSKIGENITIEILDNGTVVVTPEPDWSGIETVRFTASDGEEVAFISTKITVKPVDDPPTVEIVLPRTETYFIYNLTLLRGISFVSVSYDPDIPYGDKINLTWLSNISGILGYEPRLDDIVLPVGDHKIELIGKDNVNLTARDSIVIHVIPKNQTEFITPEVKLLTPLLNVTVNSTSVVLSWTVLNLNESDRERVLFDIYLDTSEVPHILVTTEYLNDNITISGLEDNTTYYWTVIPYLDNFPGICVDDVWNFTVDLNFTARFGVELFMEEPELLVNAGQVKIYNFSIQNTGNIVDRFSFSLKFINDNDFVNYTMIEVYNVTLQSLAVQKINITFNIPKNYTSGEDIMLLFATSIISPALSNFSKNLTIIGYLPSNGIEKAPDEIPAGLVSMLFWLIVIMIIILAILIIFIILFIFMLKRQEKLNYPVKTKQIIRKERSILKEKGDAGVEAEEVITSKRAIPTGKAATEKPPKAKPATAVTKSSKVATVTPIRITSILGKDSEEKSSSTKESDTKTSSDKSSKK